MIRLTLSISGAAHKAPTTIEETLVYAVSGVSENLMYLEADAPKAIRVKVLSAESGTERFVEVEVTPRLRDKRHRRIKGAALLAHPDYWNCTLTIPLPLGCVVNFATAQRTERGFCVWMGVSGSEQMPVTRIPYALSIPAPTRR
jgi:hypothetical protein